VAERAKGWRLLSDSLPPAGASGLEELSNSRHQRAEVPDPVAACLQSDDPERDRSEVLLVLDAGVGRQEDVEVASRQSK